MAAAHGLQRNRAAATAQIPEGLRWIRADRIKDRRREAPLAALVAHGRLQNCSGAEAPGIAGGVLHDAVLSAAGAALLWAPHALGGRQRLLGSHGGAEPVTASESRSTPTACSVRWAPS